MNTSTRQAERSEAFYNGLIENSDDVILLTGVDNKITYQSPATGRITGWSEPERLGRETMELVHPDDAEQLGECWHFALENPLLPVHYIWMQGVMTNLLNDKNVKGIVWNLKDISVRKKSEEDLQKMIREISDYKFALDESSIVAITDQKGIIKHANDNFCKISKYTREELIGADHRIINSGYHSPEFIRELWTTIAKGKIWSGDIRNKAKDGSTYWVETTIVPFLDEHGKPYQYVAIRADITQRKKTEEELSNNVYELQRSNDELEQFAYIASHDLQEPLRMVGNYMQLLQRRYKGRLDKDADEFIHFAVDGAMRMKQLIADLLNYSRMNKEGVVGPLATNDIMTLVMRNISASLKEKKGVVHFGDLPQIEADRTQMIQLFQNLLSNAIKFSREGVPPVVEVSAKKQDKHWLFSVSDNGIGIDKQYHENVFVIFKQLNNKVKYSGTGIGLAIAKKIVERHRGKIWFESEPGIGTTFFFTLNSIA